MFGPKTDSAMRQWSNQVLAGFVEIHSYRRARPWLSDQ
jgi:hypothetical protein